MRGICLESLLRVSKMGENLRKSLLGHSEEAQYLLWGYDCIPHAATFTVFQH